MGEGEGDGGDGGEDDLSLRVVLLQGYVGMWE